MSLDTREEKNLDGVLKRQKEAYLKEGVVSARTRIDRINRAIGLVVDNQDALCQALSKDFGYRSVHVSYMMDIIHSVAALRHARQHLKKWMKPVKRKTLFPMNLFGGRSWVEYQPKGVVGIINTWNLPVGLTFAPMAEVLAAGNRCMIKLSRVTPATSELMKQLIPTAFDETEMAVFTLGPGGGRAFSTLKFDHLIYTGSTVVGRQIMQAAAENLVPVTLELGGKSPVIIGRSARLDQVSESLVTNKLLNAGQACVAPDYIFVPEENLETLTASLKNAIRKLFPTLLNNPDYTSIINRSHHKRLQGYLKDAREKGATIVDLNPADEDFTQQPHYKLPLTLILNPNEHMTVMQEEIFGPILPIMTYQDTENVLSYINSKPRPLALYYFGKDDKEIKQVLSHTTSGGVTLNDIMMHVTQHDLPFGGIGSSGMGCYHGHDGFKTFSHAKSIYKQTRINLAALVGLVPPYGSKTDRTLRSQIKK